MRTWIEEATTRQQWDAICDIRSQVFTTEWGFSYAVLDPPGTPGIWHLLARNGNGQGVGTLSIVDTTPNYGLHQRYHMHFGRNDRVARYAQLAIVKPFRKLGIPQMLIDHAKEHIVRSNGFDVGWLLYPAAHADSCLLARSLGFTAAWPVLETEFGQCRALIRRESVRWTTWDLPLQQRIDRRQQVLADIKRELVHRLQLPLQPEDIDDDTPLFSGPLGLHLTDSQRVAKALEDRFAIAMSEDDTGALRTINTLADFVERARDASGRPHEAVL